MKTAPATSSRCLRIIRRCVRPAVVILPLSAALLVACDGDEPEGEVREQPVPVGVAALKAERATTAESFVGRIGRAAFDVLAEAQKRTAMVEEAQILAFDVPAIAGIGNVGGFELRLQDLQGGRLTELASAAGGLIVAANQNPALAQVFTTSR